MEEARLQFQDYLTNYKVKRGQPFTHTSRVPQSSYCIDGEHTQPFLTAYCNAVSKKVVPTLTEKPEKYGPLRVDVDIKSDLETGTVRQYSLDMIKKIVGYYQDIIKQIALEEEFNANVLYCLVLEKKAPRKQDGKIKDGFHLHFPYFICEGWIIEYTRNVVSRKIVENNIFANIKAVDSPDKFLDRDMAKKVWLMYGSAKDIDAEPFTVTKCFDDKLKIVTLEEIFEMEMSCRTSSVKYYLPQFLSIRGYNEEVAVPIKHNVDKLGEHYKRSKKIKKIKPGTKRRSEEDIMTDIKMIKDGNIMNMLSQERADDHDKWMEVGFTLFNIGQGNEETLDMWIEFSKRSEKFTEGICNQRWDRMEVRDKTVASLLYMAKQDDPDSYIEWRRMNIKYSLKESLVEDDPNEYDVAVAFHSIYKDRFLCADSKKDLWYEFRDHRWQKLDDSIALKALFPKEFRNYYIAHQAELVAEEATVSIDDLPKLQRQQKKCIAVKKQLKTDTFTGKLLRQCKILFHDSTFLMKMNENKNLFVCANGVLDLESCMFREGRPDDCMTFSCGVEYRKFYEEDDDIVDLRDFFAKVFPNPKLRRYFFDSACAALQGGNANKTFIIGTGHGDNGKSVVYGFLEDTFGEYCIKFPRELVIAGKTANSGSARPELARVKGRRLALLQELSKFETINIGVIKELTGNDSFFARGMYKDGEDIKPMFTLMAQFNEPPRIPGNDEATWNRVRLLDYESTFVLPKNEYKIQVPKTTAEQMKAKIFKADLKIPAKLKDLGSAFLWLLFEQFKTYKKDGLIEPDEVKASTNKYHLKNDTYLQFKNDRLEEVKVSPQKAGVGASKEDTRPFIKLVDMFCEFTAWYKTTFPDYKEKHSRLTVASELEQPRILGPLTTRGKKSTVKGWYNYRFVVEEEETRKLGPNKDDGDAGEETIE